MAVSKLITKLSFLTLMTSFFVTVPTRAQVLEYLSDFPVGIQYGGPENNYWDFGVWIDRDSIDTFLVRLKVPTWSVGCEPVGWTCFVEDDDNGDAHVTWVTDSNPIRPGDYKTFRIWSGV